MYGSLFSMFKSDTISRNRCSMILYEIISKFYVERGTQNLHKAVMGVWGIKAVTGMMLQWFFLPVCNKYLYLMKGAFGFGCTGTLCTIVNW